MTGMLKKRNRIEHLRGTNLGVAQPRPQDSPMFYEKKKPYGQDWTCLTFTKHTSSNTLVVSLFTEDCLKVILPMKENCVLV